MLRYEHVQPGQRIKAYDHAPFPGRLAKYLTGKVIGHYEGDFGVMYLKVVCEFDATFKKHSRIGKEVRVPMEISGEDVEYTDEARVQVLA